MERPPYRRPLMIERPSDRIGLPYIQVDPSKIIGIVETNMPDEARGFSEPDAVTEQIGHNVAAFLANDMRKGTIPSTFLPLQSGVGNIANAVLSALGKDSSIPPFEMYTEVIQNSVIKLIKEGRIKFGSTCSLSVTNDCLQDIYENMDFFINKLVLRPSEISNCPEVVRRIGVISMNTAIEADIYGNVNSTHICGTKMMNGIGGSGDFTRSAYISIFSCPSTAKEVVSVPLYRWFLIRIIVNIPSISSLPNKVLPICAERVRWNGRKSSLRTVRIRITNRFCGTI